MESIEYVERSKENAIPSANDLLSKWDDAGEEVEYKQNTVMCSVGDSDPVLMNLKALMGAQGWYQRGSGDWFGALCSRPLLFRETRKRAGHRETDVRARRGC